MRLLHSHSAEVAPWVGWRIPAVRRRMERDPEMEPFGPAYAIGVLNAVGSLVAGVVFHGWDPDYSSIEASFAADTPQWATRQVLSDILDYPFEVLQCNRLMVAVARHNRPSRQFVDRFGFRREGVATDGFGPGADAVISRMLRKEWLASRWCNRARLSRDQTASI